MDRESKNPLKRMVLRRNDHSRVIALIALLMWSAVAVSLVLSLSNLSAPAFWISFVGFFLPISIYALSWDPGYQGQTGDYPIKLGRYGSVLLGLVSIAVLSGLVIFMNSSSAYSLKMAVFEGAGSGGITGISWTLTYLEFFFPRFPDSSGRVGNP